MGHWCRADGCRLWAKMGSDLLVMQVGRMELGQRGTGAGCHFGYLGRLTQTHVSGGDP
jgi:hypothetical protein